MSTPPADPPPPSGLRRGLPARPRESMRVPPQPSATDYATPPLNIARPPRQQAPTGNGGSQIRRERIPGGDTGGRSREPVLREVVPQPPQTPYGTPQPRPPMTPLSPTSPSMRERRAGAVIDVYPGEVTVSIGSPTDPQQPVLRPRDQPGRRRVPRRVVEHALPALPDPTSPRAFSPPAPSTPTQPMPMSPVSTQPPPVIPPPRPSTPPQVNNGSTPQPVQPSTPTAQAFQYSAPAAPAPPYIPPGGAQAWPTSPIPPPPLQQHRPYPFQADPRRGGSYQRLPQFPGSPPRPGQTTAQEPTQPAQQEPTGEKASVRAPGSVAGKTVDSKDTGGGIMSLLRGAPKSPPLPPTDTTKTCTERLAHTLAFAEDECNRQQWLERIYSWGINVTILLQLLLAAAITVLSAVPGTYNIVTAVLGALSTCTAGLLARYRGTNQPERAGAHATALRNFLAECDAFVEDYGQEKGPQFDAKINELRVKLETIQENAEKAEHGVMHSAAANVGSRWAA